jgi:hypothetical protein
MLRAFGDMMDYLFDAAVVRYDGRSKDRQRRLSATRSPTLAREGQGV